MNAALSAMAELRQAAMTARAAILIAKGGKGSVRAAQQLAIAAAMRMLKARIGSAMDKASAATSALSGLGMSGATSPDLILVKLQSARNLAQAMGDASTAANLDGAIGTVRQVLTMQRDTRTLVRQAKATLAEIMSLMAALS